MRPPSSTRPSRLMPPTPILSAISGSHFTLWKKTARRKTHTVGPSKPIPTTSLRGQDWPQTWRHGAQDQHHADRPTFRLTGLSGRAVCHQLAGARDRRLGRIYRAGYRPFALHRCLECIARQVGGSARHSITFRFRAQRPRSLIRFCRNVAAPLFRRRAAPNRYARRLQSCRFPFANTGVNHKMSQENWGG